MNGENLDSYLENIPEDESIFEQVELNSAQQSPDTQEQSSVSFFDEVPDDSMNALADNGEYIAENTSLQNGHFKLHKCNGNEIDEDTLDNLSKLIDGKYSDDFRDVAVIVSKPNTASQIRNSDMVYYITYDDVPVGILTATNPTEKNYMNIVPAETYSSHCPYNLDNRLEIEYLVVSSEYEDFPIAEELVNQLRSKGIEVFMVCLADDDTTNGLLRHLHFQFIKTFNIFAINDDINLYIR